MRAAKDIAFRIRAVRAELSWAGDLARDANRNESVKKTIDISDDLKAMEKRVRALRAKQKNAIGELVIATGAEKILTDDQMTGALLDVLDRAETEPVVLKKWEEMAAAFFRRKSAAGKGAANGKPGGDDAAPSKPAKPPRVAPPPKSEAFDLLSRPQTERAGDASSAKDSGPQQNAKLSDGAPRQDPAAH
jgi:hypothetical protein